MRGITRLPIGILLIGLTGIALHVSAAGLNQVEARSPGSDLVIAEVYGGGSAASGVFSHDYVVLFNRGTSSLKLAGLFLQSADPADDFHAAANVTRLPDVTLEPGQYFLVSLSNVGIGCACPDLPLADHVDSSVLIRADNAKVTLVRAPLDACGSAGHACPLDRVVDLVGYGSATQWEGSDATGADALTSAKALRRKGNGCTDTDRNWVDFERVAPQPRNSSSPKTPCNASGVPHQRQLAVVTVACPRTCSGAMYPTVPITGARMGRVESPVRSPTSAAHLD